MRDRRTTERLQVCALAATLASGCAGYEAHELSPAAGSAEQGALPHGQPSHEDRGGDGNMSSPDEPGKTDEAGGGAGLNLSDIGKPVLISESFYFTEGPVWDPASGVRFFADINPPQAALADEESPDAGAASDAETAMDSGLPAEADGGVLDGAAHDAEGGAGDLDGSQDAAPESDASAADAATGAATDASEGGDATLDAGAQDAGSASARDAATSRADSGADASVDTVGGAIYRLTPPGTIEVFLEPAGNANGLALDPDGHLIAAGFASRNVWRLSGSGQQEVFAPCASGSASCYTDQPLNTPDDVAVRSDGTLYFTDPTFGSGQQGFPALDLPLGNAQAVYRVDTDGKIWLEDEGTSGPNGINFSPDEKTLYVSYTVSGQVVAFDVEKSGALSHKRTFATGALGADSMCVDADGNVYVGTLTGLAVFDSAGKNLGTLSVNGQLVTNCAFGGADQRTLYITARGLSTLIGAPRMGGSSLYAIRNMPVPGIPGQN